ncbi:MAG: hypothetical protein ACRDNK_14535 [Solirubrobacteraceae bacterium]
MRSTPRAHHLVSLQTGIWWEATRLGLPSVARARGAAHRAGDRLFITFSAPGRRPEAAEVIIRTGKLPRVRLLRS